MFSKRLPSSHVGSGYSPEAGPFCWEGKASEVSERSLSGSIHAEQSTAACPPRAQGRRCGTARAESLRCSAKVHVWSKAKAFSCFYGSFPHRAFQIWVCVHLRTGIPMAPWRQYKSKPVAKVENKNKTQNTQILNLKMPKGLVLGWGPGDGGEVLSTTATKYS